jgi:DEAD/DEAH box helicase domain-containing protein
MKELSFADILLAELGAWEEASTSITSSHTLLPRQASFAPSLEDVQQVLPAGIGQLYSHQAAVLEHALRGEHVTLATPTASGKTLALTLPSLIKRATYREGTVMCIAPTRALVEQWTKLVQEWQPSLQVASYTGDTPKPERRKIRERIQFLVTTPDMLHMGILPYHAGWHRFLSHLEDVYIDEGHEYSGVFGSHMALILRRLRRVILAHRAAEPSFLFASATIGNPAEHAALLLGEPVTAITENGAPSGGRRIAIWQPPDERGHSEECARLMAYFITQGIRTILFGQARQSVERMVRVVREHLPPDLQRKIVAYRAGYLYEQRQQMQQQLMNGELLGVVATNALELGIDIGHLDVSILDGYPGSVSSFWQQAGRAGRRERSALTILVLREDALDQYFSLHPEKLLEQPTEQALVNSSNPYILPRHLLCATFEEPLAPEQVELFGPHAQQHLDELIAEKAVFERRGKYYASDSHKNPAYQVPLRQVGEQLTMLIGEQKLEETDIHHATTECYEGAVYYSQGRSHLVERLDLERGTIQLVPREMGYYTEPLIQTDVDILCTSLLCRRRHASLYYGDVLVTRTVTSYVKRHSRYRNVLDRFDLENPLETELETKALWILVDDDIVTALQAHSFDPAGSLHATEHSLIALLPLHVLGDRRDVGGVSVVPVHPQTNKATIFIYDGYPGGMGYAEGAYHQFMALAQETFETLQACMCEGGCLSCVQSPKCGNQNRPLDKRGAIFLLQALLGRDEQEEKSSPQT